VATLLQPVIALEELVLQGLHEMGLAWGLAIVVLTLLVRLALVPLAVRRGQARSLRGALAGLVVQALIVLSLAGLLYGDAAAGTFADAGWLFITDLSQPPAGAALALLVGAYVGMQLLALRLVARAGRRRVAIVLLAPLPLLLVATQIPAGVLIYVVVSAAFGVVQKLALRGRARAPAPAA
jgi:YidC/Oxa1 family membrane protein insertase